MAESQFVYSIDIPHDDESRIRRLLEKALPTFQWSEGDSSWDKVRVLGERAGAFLRVYRYESPGPFDLTIRLDLPPGADAEREAALLRDAVVQAVGGSVIAT